MKPLSLAQSAGRIVEEAAGVRAGEKVLVVTDTEKLMIAEALGAAALARGAEVICSVMLPTDLHGNEISSMVAVALAAADVCLAPTTHSFTHTKGFKAALESGTRILLLRGITEEILLHGAATADYEEVRDLTVRLRDLLGEAVNVRVFSEAGTDLRMDVTGRLAFGLYGMALEPGTFAAMPDGEAAISPVEGSASGRIVFDHAMDGLGFLDRPIEIEVKGGRALEVRGGRSADALRQIVEEAGDGADNIAEFAIGTNPKARLIGSMTEDKKLLGSVHIALGDNFTLGGSVVSPIHLDGVVLRPTVEVDGKTVIERGRVLP
ncbi:MAG: aminopeptidase [Nitrospinota bacterium]